MAKILELIGSSWETEWRSRCFARKITVNRIQAMLDAAAVTTPWALYGFQEDSLTGTTVSNEMAPGTADMTLSAAGMWSGQGWYTHPCRGARGTGLWNDAGVSGNVGTIGHGAPVDLNGVGQATFIMVCRAGSTGQGGFGSLFTKNLGFQCAFIGANTLSFNVHDGGGFRGTTVAGVVYDFWHVITAVYDGSQAEADRMKIYLNGIDAGGAAANVPVTATDGGNTAYILDRSGNDRAFNGQLGCLAVIPGYAMSEAEVQSLVELRGLFQPDSGDQPDIPPAPGIYGVPEYNFVRAEEDHLTSYQTIPLRTQQGTIIHWFTPDDFTTIQAYFSLTTPGATDDEYAVYIQGTVAGDPLRVRLLIGGGASWQADAPVNQVIAGPNMLSIRSDGTTTRMFLNGVDVVLTDGAGANAGQWLADATNASLYTVGAHKRAAVQEGYDGRVSAHLVYDRHLSLLELQQIWQRGWGPSGPRWLPSS